MTQWKWYIVSLVTIFDLFSDNFTNSSFKHFKDPSYICHSKGPHNWTTWSVQNCLRIILPLNIGENDRLKKLPLFQSPFSGFGNHFLFIFILRLILYLSNNFRLYHTLVIHTFEWQIFRYIIISKLFQL